MKGLVGLEVSLGWVAFSPRFGRLNGPSNVMVSGRLENSAFRYCGQLFLISLKGMIYRNGYLISFGPVLGDLRTQAVTR